jgi:hypothetical protein
MDKGYDSEDIHRQIREDLHSDSIIPLRSWNADHVGGTYRQEMVLNFDKIRYGKRQLVETRFSVLKKRFGGDLKTRIFPVQIKEISGKMIVCNIHRFLQFLVIEVFYTANFSLFLNSHGSLPASPAVPLTFFEPTGVFDPLIVFRYIRSRAFLSYRR